MEIKFYGHACIFIKTSKLSLVTDPWLSKEGAFLSSWFQFPDNTQLDLNPVRKANYIFLSHEHQDHFDLNFLKTISPQTKIIIPKYTDSYLYDTLRTNINNEVIVANSLQKINLDEEVDFCPVVQSVPIWDDCTLIFETPEGTLVDINDMHIVDQDLEWITSNFKINYLFMQYSGASWHPYAYNYSNEKKMALARPRVINRFYNVKRVFAASKADYLIPCAGPPCFLDDEFYELNFSEATIFPNQAQFYEFAKREGFANKTVILLPGDTFDPNLDWKLISENNVQNEAFTKTRKYLDAYKERRKEIICKELASIEPPKKSLVDKCKKYFEPLIKSSPYFREKINGKLLLDVTNHINEKIIVDFTKKENQVKLFENEEFFYKIEVESKLLNLILEKKLTWEQLLLSLRFKAFRNPDEFNPSLFTFLRFADPRSYKEFELFDLRKNNSETFLLEHDGKTYEIQKYCPHAMGNLSKGRIIDNCVVCPNHGWTFSLVDGSSIYNNASIKIKTVEKEKRTK